MGFSFHCADLHQLIFFLRLVYVDCKITRHFNYSVNTIVD